MVEPRANSNTFGIELEGGETDEKRGKMVHGLTIWGSGAKKTLILINFTTNFADKNGGET